MQYCPNCNNTFVIVKANNEDGKTKAMFKCTNCEHVEAIEQGTKIISRSTKKNTESSDLNSKYKDMIHDDTLPHTRNYTCPNKKCESHSDTSKRDAVWFKPNASSYKIIFVCTSCQTVF